MSDKPSSEAVEDQTRAGAVEPRFTKDENFKLFMALLGCVFVTCATAFVGWLTSSTYAWNTPAFSFTLALFVLSWGATLAMAVAQSMKRHERALHQATREHLENLFHLYIEEQEVAEATRTRRAAELLRSVNQSERRVKSIN